MTPPYLLRLPSRGLPPVLRDRAQTYRSTARYLLWESDLAWTSTTTCPPSLLRRVLGPGRRFHGRPTPRPHAPFEVTHGARSEAIVRRVGRAQKRRLCRQIGLRVSDLDGIGQGFLDGWARAQAKVELMDSYAAEHGWLDEHGNPRGLVIVYVSMLNSARLSLQRFSEHLRAEGRTSAQAAVEARPACTRAARRERGERPGVRPRRARLPALPEAGGHHPRAVRRRDPPGVPPARPPLGKGRIAAVVGTVEATVNAQAHLAAVPAGEQVGVAIVATCRRRPASTTGTSGRSSAVRRSPRSSPGTRRTRSSCATA